MLLLSNQIHRDDSQFQAMCLIVALKFPSVWGFQVESKQLLVEILEVVYDLKNRCLLWEWPNHSSWRIPKVLYLSFVGRALLRVCIQFPKSMFRVNFHPQVFLSFCHRYHWMRFRKCSCIIQACQNLLLCQLRVSHNDVLDAVSSRQIAQYGGYCNTRSSDNGLSITYIWMYFDGLFHTISFLAQGIKLSFFISSRAALAWGHGECRG